MIDTASAPIPIVVISLADATARRAKLAERMAELGLAYSTFDAVRGTAMTAAEITALKPRPVVAEFGRALSKGELGCIASYRAVLLQIAAGSAPHVCIAEDDAVFTAEAMAFLAPAFLARIPAFDVLRLGGDLGPSRFAVPVLDHAGRAVTMPLHSYYCATAQIVSRAGAARLARRLVPADAPLDHMIYRDPSSAFRVLDVRPLPVGADAVPSTIGEGRDAVAHPGSTHPGWWIARNIHHMARKTQLVPRFAQAWGWPMLTRLRRLPPL